MRLWTLCACVSVLVLPGALAAGLAPESIQAAADAILRDNPEDFRALYNRGWARYKLGKYADVGRDFRQALAKAPEPARPDTLYNLGNALFMQQDLAGAARIRREALRLVPDDAGLQYNYTVARRMLDQQKKDKQDKKDDKNKDKDKKDSDKKDGKQDDKQKPEQDKDRQDKQNQADRDKQRRTPEGQMKKEDALRLLQALDEQERRNTPREKAEIGGVRQEKDW